MGFSIDAARSGVRSCMMMGLALSVMAIGLTVVPTQSSAQVQISYATDPFVVRNDRGGLLRERLRQISQLRAQSRPVEIRGAVCLSTCTMFLGLPNTCISPRTTFGFHGPSSYGRMLDPETFNYASEVIASYYPAPLKSWYMETARFKINTISRVKGAQIINMGIRAC